MSNNLKAFPLSLGGLLAVSGSGLTLLWAVLTWRGHPRESSQAPALRKIPLCQLLQQLPLRFGQIKPVHRLGETQIGVNTGNDNACIYRQDLDAHKGDTDINIDHQALVKDGVDDIREAAR